MQAVIATSVGLVRDNMNEQVEAGIEKIKEEMESANEDGFPIQAGYGVMNVGAAIAAASMHMFIFGYETCQQYGKNRG